MCYKVVSTDPDYYSAPRLFRGKDCIVQFLDTLKHDISKIKEHLKRTLEMNLTEEENATFLASTKCHICGDGEKSNDPFVRDHCHLTGRFRGAAHNSCNLNYGLCPDKVKIPVFFHNLRGFDSHLILKYVKPKQHGSIKCIPKNGEQVISMSIRSAVFNDSAAFLSGSLEKLIESLPKNHMILTRQFLEQMELNGTSAFDTEPVKLKKPCKKVRKESHEVELDGAKIKKNEKIANTLVDEMSQIDENSTNFSLTSSPPELLPDSDDEENEDEFDDSNSTSREFVSQEKLKTITKSQPRSSRIKKRRVSDFIDEEADSSDHGCNGNYDLDEEYGSDLDSSGENIPDLIDDDDLDLDQERE